MSKTKEDYKEVAEKINKPEPKEVIKNLKEQMVDYKKQYEYYQTMYTKAQGAVEVLQQLNVGDNKDDS